MSFSSLAGDGSITGDGSIAGDGSIGGDGSTGTGYDGGFSGYLPSSLITAREGIVGFWTRPGSGPGDAPFDDGKQMRHWEGQVRAQVLDFELLSSFQLDTSSSGIAKLNVRNGSADLLLVELVRPTAVDLLENQLAHVNNYADLRRDRTAEILSQIKGIDIFLSRLSPIHPQRHRFTLELLAACFRAIVLVEMRIKHTLAVPRPVEFSPQIMPMIQTPGHGSFPAGHAVESFMLATVLSALMQAGGGTRYVDWNTHLAKLAARISLNRVIAGVHFPIDVAGGLVLGLSVGRYFVARASGAQADLTPCKFEAKAYAGADFPWAPFPWANILDPTVPLPGITTGIVASNASFRIDALTQSQKDSSPLCWLWGEAVKEWQ